MRVEIARELANAKRLVALIQTETEKNKRIISSSEEAILMSRDLLRRWVDPAY